MQSDREYSMRVVVKSANVNSLQNQHGLRKRAGRPGPRLFAEEGTEYNWQSIYDRG